MIKVMSVFGTRPEAIKMCPLIKKMKEYKEIESIVCVTAQHREMLDQVLDVFEITPDYDLDIMKTRQSLNGITTKILDGMDKVLTEANPDIVLVHGDTTTSFAAALAAFYKQIPVGHVEAGLRTWDKYSPFPEEMNRNLTGKIAEMHFAPTLLNKSNLENENIKENIFVTGNTVLDSFETTVKENYSFKEECLNKMDFSKGRYVLLTAHRRENLGENLENMCNAVKRLVNELEDINVIYPVHLNPAVQQTVKSILSDIDRVHLINPIDVTDMHNLLTKCNLLLTDSGGLQEEGPSFNIPVLVLRTETERPEAVEAGTVKVVGVNEEDIYSYAKTILIDSNEYSKFLGVENPYGDGTASEKIIDAILQRFKA